MIFRRRKIIAPKTLSIILSLALVWALAIVPASAAPAFAAPTAAVNYYPQTLLYSTQNELGEMVRVYGENTPDQNTIQVFVGGKLTQAAVYENGRINVTLYTDARANVGAEHRETMGIPTTVRYAPSSAEAEPKQALVLATPAPRFSYDDLYNEPVDNSGLSSSGYGDGYYYIGEAGDSIFPGYTGVLSRKYTTSYLGETKYWHWNSWDTLSAITAVLSLVLSPTLLGLTISLVSITADGMAGHSQNMYLETIDFHYKYRVRVSGSISYEPSREIDYWKISNTTEHTTKWEKDQQLGGVLEDNQEIVKHGIENYIQAHR